MRLHIAVLLTIYGLCAIEKGTCWDQTDSHDPVEYSDKQNSNYNFSSPVYVISSLNYFGNISAILAKWNARLPANIEVDTTFRFQLWEKTNNAGVFTFRGENVFTYKEIHYYNSFPEFYPNDTDQLTIKPYYYVGFYANGPTYFVYNKSVCKGDNKTWTFPVSDPSSPPSLGSDVTFQQYGDGTECLGFAFRASGIEIDLSCQQEILSSVDGEGFIDINPKEDIKDLSGNQPDKCWVIRIQRPCTSTYKRYLSLSVQMVEPEGCQDIHNFEFHNGGKQTYVTDMRCKDNVPTFHGYSTLFYFQYKVNAGHHFDHVKLRYFIDFDDEYVEYNPVELCEGETLPQKTQKRGSVGGIIAGVIIITTIIIIVVVVIVVCNKGRKASQTNGSQNTEPTAGEPLQNTPGQQVQILPMQGHGNQPQVVYYPQPLNTTTQPQDPTMTQPEIEPQTPPPPYTGDPASDTAPFGMSQVEM